MQPYVKQNDYVANYINYTFKYLLVSVNNQIK